MFNNVQYKDGDLVFFQEKDQKSWKGPAKVISHKGRDVFVMANGSLKKVADCRVQLYDTREIGEDVKEGDGTLENDEKKEDRMKDKKQDCVGTYWMLVEKNECFKEELTIYNVEVPRKEHGRPEVIEAKKKEFENLQNYETFEEVSDEGQERIMSRLIKTHKLKLIGQKQEIQA